jgi:hypothetical protein
MGEENINKGELLYQDSIQGYMHQASPPQKRGGRPLFQYTSARSVQIANTNTIAANRA